MDGFFAEVMVNSVDLFFAANLVDNPVEGLGGSKISSKGFFDDESGFGGVFQHAGHAELANCFWEEVGGDREVEDSIASGIAQFVEFGEKGFELLVAHGVVDVAGAVK